MLTTITQEISVAAAGEGWGGLGWCQPLIIITTHQICTPAWGALRKIIIILSEGSVFGIIVLSAFILRLEIHAFFILLHWKMIHSDT